MLQKKDPGKQLMQGRLLEPFGLCHFELGRMSSIGKTDDVTTKERRQRRWNEFLVAAVSRSASIP